MAGLNEVRLIGNLGANPEVRYTQSGTAVATLSVATNEVWTDKKGEKQEKTEWHRVVVWGKQAESCAEHLEKGRQVCVLGKLQTRKWEDKDGRDNWTTEVVAHQVIFLGSGQGKGRRPEPDDFGAPPPRHQDTAGDPRPDDFGLPF